MSLTHEPPYSEEDKTIESCLLPFLVSSLSLSLSLSLSPSFLLSSDQSQIEIVPRPTSHRKSEKIGISNQLYHRNLAM